MAGSRAFIAQGAAADDLSCPTMTEAMRPVPSLCCAQKSSFLTQAASVAMKADIPTDNGGDRWQAPVTGVQGTDDLPPGRAARDGSGQHQDAFRRDEGTDNGA
jgi:hypothetical protein